MYFELYIACFLRNSKKKLKVFKNLKLIQDINNVEIHKRAKQLEIPYNIGCVKITKSGIPNSEQCKLSER
jgi:hypothetical protein